MIKKMTVLFILAALLFTGCGMSQEAQLTETAQVTLISGARTLEARLSQTPEPTETLQPSFTPSATATPLTVSTLTPSPTLGVTATSRPVTTCDSARFLDDVTIPDGTTFDPGETFTKTWRLENFGTCSWTTEYTVAFLTGDRMGGETYTVSEEVTPGETHDVSIEMKAPFEAGTYTGTWTIKNDRGISFGETFYVQIEVSSSATATPKPSATSEPTATVQPTSTATTADTATATATPSGD